MPPRDRRRRTASSCEGCRRRKIKCEKPASLPCQRCARLKIECVLGGPLVRPYYHTSKERFELMATVVRHLVPSSSLSIENLREIVHQLPRDPACFLQNSRLSVESDRASPPVQTVTSTPTSDHVLPSVLEAMGGAFIKDSANTRRFDGGTSYNAFQSKVSNAFSSIPSKSPIQFKLELLHRQTALSSCDDTVPNSPKVPLRLPDRRALEQASTVFFAEVNSIIYVLNQDRFFSSFDRIYDSHCPYQASTIATLHLIIALAQGSNESFETACLHTDAIIEEGVQESVEAFMLMALYRRSRDQRHLAWVLLGNAVRIAQSLGLHLLVENESPYLAESRSRLWWSLYDIDQWFSCTVGRPQGICESCTIPLPSERMIASPFTPPGYPLASATLSKILRRVLQCLCKEGPGRADIQPQLNTLFDEIQSWWTELPTHLHDCSAVAPSLLRTTLHLQLKYHYIVCLIARPFLFSLAFQQEFADEVVLEWAELGEQANRDAIRILKVLQTFGHLSSSFWLDLHYVLCAGIILLLRVLRNPTLASYLQEVDDFLPTLRITSHTRIGQFAVKCFENLLQDAEEGNKRGMQGAEGTDRDANQVVQDLGLQLGEFHEPETSSYFDLLWGIDLPISQLPSLD